MLLLANAFLKIKMYTEGKLENTERSKDRKSAKRVSLKSHHKIEMFNYIMKVAHTMVVIVSIYKSINQHVLHLKTYTMLHVNYSSVKLEKTNKRHREKIAIYKPRREALEEISLSTP